MNQDTLHETSLRIGDRVEVRQMNLRTGKFTVYRGRVVGYDNTMTRYLVYSATNNANGMMLTISAYPGEVIEHIWSELVFRS